MRKKEPGIEFEQSGRGGGRFYNNENQFPSSFLLRLKFTLGSRIRWVSREELFGRGIVEMHKFARGCDEE